MKGPNILLLHTDQQRFNTIAALGAGHMTTPNLDRLVRQVHEGDRQTLHGPAPAPVVTGIMIIALSLRVPTKYRLPITVWRRCPEC